MENVDWNSIRFSPYAMLPNSGEEVTTNWARQLVNNLYSAYGIVGTAQFENRPIRETLNPGKSYQSYLYSYVRANTNIPITMLYPSGAYRILIYWEDDNGVLYFERFAGPEYAIWALGGNTGGYSPYVTYSQDSAGNLFFSTNDPRVNRVYYRIVGI